MSSPPPDELASLDAAQRAQLDIIMSNLRHQLPVIAAGAIFTEQLLKEVQSVLLRNMGKIIATALIAGGLSILIPALTVAIVNAVGFTAGGVVAGSLAAAIQSAVYGGFTGGIFSVLQSFGATAIMASPAAIAVASVAVVAGGGYLVYRKFKNRKNSTNHQHADDESGGDPDTPRGTTRSALNSKISQERADPHSASTSLAGADAMVYPYRRRVRNSYHRATAGAVGNSRTEHRRATGNGILSEPATHSIVDSPRMDAHV